MADRVEHREARAELVGPSDEAQRVGHVVEHTEIEHDVPLPVVVEGRRVGDLEVGLRQTEVLPEEPGLRDVVGPQVHPVDPARAPVGEIEAEPAAVAAHVEHAETAQLVAEQPLDRAADQLAAELHPHGVVVGEDRRAEVVGELHRVDATEREGHVPGPQGGKSLAQAVVGEVERGPAHEAGPGALDAPDDAGEEVFRRPRAGLAVAPRLVALLGRSGLAVAADRRDDAFVERERRGGVV